MRELDAGQPHNNAESRTQRRGEATAAFKTGACRPWDATITPKCAPERYVAASKTAEGWCDVMWVMRKAQNGKVEKKLKQSQAQKVIPALLEREAGSNSAKAMRINMMNRM